MKHIPAEFEQTKELFIFKCINCNVKLGSFIEAFHKWRNIIE